MRVETILLPVIPIKNEWEMTDGMYAVKRLDEEVIKWMAAAMVLAMVGLAVLPTVSPQQSNVGYLVWYYLGGSNLSELWAGVTNTIATGVGGALGGWAAAQLGARIGGTAGAFIGGPVGVAIGGIVGAA